MFRRLLCVLTFLPFYALAQVDEQAGERENFVLAPDGTALVVQTPQDNQATLVRRAPNGAISNIVVHGQSLAGETLDGIGSNPHMNASGVAAFQATFNADRNFTGIFTGTPGSVTKIGKTGDTLNGKSICDIEPFPEINASGQVFFGTTVDFGNGCEEDGDSINSAKAIFRFTPPSTTTLMLYAEFTTPGTPDTITVSNTDFVTSQTTFEVIDAHLIGFGGNVVGDNGAALVTAWLASDGTGQSKAGNKDAPNDPSALLYLTGPNGSLTQSANLVAMSGGSEFPDLEDGVGKGVMSNSGRVFFSGNNGDDLRLWSTGAGYTTVVQIGDSLPSGPGTFNGFAPHQDINGSGHVSFTAGLDISATCTGDDFNGYSRSPPGDIANRCRGVYFYDGSLHELARDTVAKVASSGAGAPSSADGFDFDQIGSVTVLEDNDRVIFVAENLDPVSGCPAPSSSDGDLDFGERETTGIFTASQGSINKIVAEGDPAPGGGRISRLFVPMPELRQHSNTAGQFIVRVWVDSDNDCQSDREQTLLAGFVAEGGAIPLLGPWGVLLLTGLLALAGGIMVLRRQPG